ncbi:3-(methylthio)propionyl-CoA ligase [Azospirillum thermophilum]|uniref:3-methylmercaptopropionyl-CoA ligase n=1 Tax=Azospirillum thermophilum TaxID=2202148 RepID=A0A2S2CKQ3_9PROT|nr:3-(methylthio)propionyl-CoA ligase [Azospirillum thermophilum]AWK85083.1 long-chain fatty acid--CoA ligase [Azospirillum thermophilum]
MLRGLMMDAPLLVTSILRHAALYHADTEIVSRTVEGPIHRTTYGEAWVRVQKLAHALAGLGLKPGDRVGTLAWNGYRHLELYYGVGGSGMVCHTINPRLFPEQIAYIINHADDAVLFTDLTFVPLLEGIAPEIAGVKAIVVMTDAEHMPASSLPNLLCYETLLEGQPESFDWPELDENTACGLCYTSGTTGNPKGVMYSHRSAVLHGLASSLPDVFNLSSRDCVLPVVPMFHVNAWGVPYSAPLNGCKLVFPGAKLDGASLYELFESEGVTNTAGVPTVWLALLNWLDANRKKPTTLRKVAIGGSACPPVMIQRFRELGVEVLHAWGMTETSPLGLANTPKKKHDGQSADDSLALASKQGRPIFGVQFRVVDGAGNDVPRDGKAFGRMMVRGPWVCGGYYGLADSAAHASLPGWFETGDVVTMDADGYVQIVDRTKDVIKSGGEWISSIDLENIAVAHPAVQEAAAVARPDEKWGERPVLVVVLKPGQPLTAQELAAFYEGKVAKWCIPDDIRFVESLPHTATGKLLKTAIRDMVLHPQPAG